MIQVFLPLLEDLSSRIVAKIRIYPFFINSVTNLSYRPGKKVDFFCDSWHHRAPEGIATKINRLIRSRMSQKSDTGATSQIVKSVLIVLHSLRSSKASFHSSRGRTLMSLDKSDFFFRRNSRAISQLVHVELKGMTTVVSLMTALFH